MASYEFRKVNCIDPCDPRGTMHRQLALLVQVGPTPRNTNTNMSISLGWRPEPILVNPVRMVDEITADTCNQKIHVIDPIFGSQLLQYITDQQPLVCFDASNDRNEITALWAQAVRVPSYAPGQARATAYFTPGEVKMDGARSDFAASFNAKYTTMGEIPADDIPTYCHCLMKSDDGSGRQMIQCANEERYCLKEWYHLNCIGMTKEDVPPGDIDWFCDECVEGRLGKLKTINYIPWKLWEQNDGKRVHLPEKGKVRKKEEPLRKAELKTAAGRREAASNNYGYETMMIPAPSRQSPLRTLSSALPTPELSHVFVGAQVLDKANLWAIDTAPASDRFRFPIDTQPYSAELDKQFVLTNQVDFSNTTLAEARTSLLQPARNDNVPVPATPKKGKWRSEEEDALVAVVRECVSAGLVGEPMWEAAHPRLQARGVDRTIAAMKMVWCRGLRERCNIDERRVKDSENMRTALQDGIKRARGKKGRQTKNTTELEKCEMQFRDAVLLSAATGGPILGRKRAASV